MNPVFLPEGEFTRTKRRYTVGGRNDWYCIDEYTDRGMMRNVDGFKTRKQANMTAGHLNGAYSDGLRDALVGMILPLHRLVEHREYRPADRRTIIEVGTKVAVVGRDGWQFKCKVLEDKGEAGAGLEFTASYEDLRPQPPE
jgi:hypothetical protein